MASELAKKILPGNPITASLFEAIRKIVLPLSKLSCEPPLEMFQDGGSTTFRIAYPLVSTYAVTTSIITAKVTATRTLGTGTATLRQLTYTSGVATYASSGQSVAIYNGNAATVASGEFVMLNNINGQWHLTNDYCNQ